LRCCIDEDRSENNSKEVTGIVGKEESPSARINITASYGSVKLY